MTWVWVSLLAYFLLAVSSVLDKALLKRRIPNPSVFSFYVSILGVVAFVLAPFGLKWIGFSLLSMSIFSGALFTYAMLFMFMAVRKNEVSRVTPLVISAIQIVTFLIAIIFSVEILNFQKIAGVALLFFGGFFISFDLPIKSLKIFSGFKFAVLGGFLFALAYSLFGYIYRDENAGFVSGFIWTRVGLLIGGASLLIVPSFRKEIFSTLRAGSKKKKKNRKGKKSTIFLFFVNKASSSIASVLMNYAFSIGSVAYVQAMASAQFVFVLLLASIASMRRPDIFEEKLYFWDWFQKIVSIGIIGVGVALVSL
ncbi:MAG: DMT family transporter [Candidatus Moranbacteria bacterium]|nr:DMT family transporter [Candidatus Moranbacteria bacterium]